jgi:hypothetical protein
MIIIEGPDGAGKTTLKDEILNRYPQRVKEGTRGTKDRSKLYEVTVPDTFRAINMAIRATGTSFGPIGGEPRVHVWDRLFFSDMVYAPIQGRPCQFSPGQQHFIRDILETIDCPIILCLPPFEVVKENAQVHEQMTGVNENLKTIWTSYANMYWQMPNQTVIYDYTGSRDDLLDEHELYKMIDRYLHERSKREWSQG